VVTFTAAPLLYPGEGGGIRVLRVMRWQECGWCSRGVLVPMVVVTGECCCDAVCDEAF